MPKAYACFNMDKNEREKSSSGGIFILLAKKIIKQKGVVFGVRFDKNWRVVHDYAENIEDAEAFLTSKYAQSSMGDMFSKVKEFLENNRKVLFSGTPCQISGLKSYLGKEYHNLLTVDFICHGVPSPKVWEEYLEEKSKGKTIRAVNFRDKTKGWKKFSLKIEFEDGSIYSENQFQDLYLKGFLRDIYLRPSCYQCMEKGINRISDITLSDFWGIEDVKPEMLDDRGISAVLIHSLYGEVLWKEISNEMIVEEVDSENVIQHNLNAIISVKKPKERDYFFQKQDIKIMKKIKKYTKTKKIRKLKIFIRSAIRKLKNVLIREK